MIFVRPELKIGLFLSSGIIHFADSEEVFNALPYELKNLLKEMPATWDKTTCIIAEPGKSIVLSRQKDNLSYIVGINGTNTIYSVSLDLAKYCKDFSKFTIISEGKDSLTDFKVQSYSITSKWEYNLVPKRAFIIQFIK